MQSGILVAQVGAGLITRNEARSILGQDNVQGTPEADELMITTGTGATPLSTDVQIDQKKKLQTAFPPPPPPTQVHIGPDGKPVPAPPGSQGGAEQPKPGAEPAAQPAKPAPKPAPAAAANDKAAKVQRAAASVSVSRPTAMRARAGIKTAAQRAFKACKASVARQVAAALDRAAKAAPPDHGDGQTNDDRISAVETAAATAQDTATKIADDLDLSSLDVMVDAVDSELFDLAVDTSTKALAGVGVRVEGDLVNRVNERAVAFSRDRAAELVGKRWTADGELIDNPNARWAIDGSTRSTIRGLIEQGLADNIGTPAIADSIKASTAFSDNRADLVARTEVSNANEQSKLDGWRMAPRRRRGGPEVLADRRRREGRRGYLRRQRGAGLARPGRRLPIWGRRAARASGVPLRRRGACSRSNLNRRR